MLKNLLRKSFLYFLKKAPNFQETNPPPRKKKKKKKKLQETGTLKKSLMFQEMEIFRPSQESFFYFIKIKPPKNFLYFLKRKLFFSFSKKLFIFQEINFRSRKKSTLKKLLIFQEMELFNP